MDCRAQYSVSVAERAEVLSESFPDCVCERESVSIYSPGLVESHEVLCRILLYPKHFDGLKLTNSALQAVWGSGASVLRLNHAGPLAIERNADSLIQLDRQRRNKEDPGDETGLVLYGAATIDVSAVRAVKYADDVRALCVFDSGEPHEPAHADILANRRKDSTKKERRSAQLRIMESLESSLTVLKIEEVSQLHSRLLESKLTGSLSRWQRIGSLVGRVFERFRRMFRRSKNGIDGSA